MPVVTYVDHQGHAYEAEVNVGQSAMEGAVNNGIDGIVAECGGACVCATCHVIVEDAWTELTGPASDDENMMLEASSERHKNSRLSCQLIVTEEMDGLVLNMPASQY